MSSKWKVFVLGALVAVGLANVASAVPTYNIWAKVSGPLSDPDPNVVDPIAEGPAGVPAVGLIEVGGTVDPDPAGTYMIDFFVTVDTPDAGKTFGGVTFDITLTGGLVENPNLPGYQPTHYHSIAGVLQSEDTNGGTSGGTIKRWDENVDQGAADLLGITVWNAIGTNAADTRRTLGTTGINATAPAANPNVLASRDVTAMAAEARRHYAGSLFVDYDGIGSYVTVTYQTTINLDLTTRLLAEDPDTSNKNAAQIHFQGIPEPASIALLGLGGLGLIARRRCA